MFKIDKNKEYLRGKDLLKEKGVYKIDDREISSKFARLL